MGVTRRPADCRGLLGSSGVEEVECHVVEPGLGQLVDHLGQLGPGGLTVGLLEDRAKQGGDPGPGAHQLRLPRSCRRRHKRGFTHICGKGRSGRFWLKRITIAKRMRAKLKSIYDRLKRDRHLPIPEQGRWLASVLRGHLAYYAVPGNGQAIQAFRYQVTRRWPKALPAAEPATSPQLGAHGSSRSTAAPTCQHLASIPRSALPRSYRNRDLLPLRVELPCAAHPSKRTSFGG